MRTLAKEIALWNNFGYVDNCMISRKWMSVKVFVLGLATTKQQHRCLSYRRLAMETILKGTLPTSSGHFLRLGEAEGALPSKGKTGNPAQYLFSIMND